MHQAFLQAALTEAWRGRGLCAPNPSVGAVAVVNGTIIARACHQGAGTPHAEQLLLAQIPPHTPDLTLYVTLEPCNHWGRTPPCIDVIIAHGIKRVVYAYTDPNPQVANNDTPAKLRAQGVEVIHYPLAEIDAFYQSYHFWTLTKRPFVTVKMAQSLDGKIAGPDRTAVQISNPSCAAFTHTQRRYTDVILTTAQTILCDDPLFNARLPDTEIGKTLAVLARMGSVANHAKIFKVASQIELFHADNVIMPDTLAKTRCHSTPVCANGLDLTAVLQTLGALGFHDVWVEAGARLFHQLHKLQLVQRSYLYIAPHILGSNALSLYDDNIFAHPHVSSWQVFDDNAVCRIDWEPPCSQV